MRVLILFFCVSLCFARAEAQDSIIAPVEGAFFGDRSFLMDAHSNRVILAANSTKVYIYEERESAWIQVAELAPVKSPENTDSFKLIGVSIFSDRAVVDMTSEIIVYQFSNSSWQEETRIRSQTAGAVSIKDYMLIDGNPDHHFRTPTFTGTASLYELVDGTWTQTHVFEPVNEGIPLTSFGSALSLDGNRIGFSNVYHGGSGFQFGAVHLYKHDQATWTAENTISGSQFAWGRLLDIDGDRIMVATDGNVHFQQSPATQLLIYNNNEGNLIKEFSLLNNDLAYVSSMVLHDSIAVFSAVKDQKVGIYVHDGAEWELRDSLFTPAHLSESAFGFSLNIAGDRLLVGDAGVTIEGRTGAIYVYDLPELVKRDSPSTNPPADSTSTQNNPSFSETALTSIYPNPGESYVTIQYRISEPDYVRIYLYDALGRRIVQVVDQQKERGSHETYLDVRSLPSGVYFCQMQIGDQEFVQRLAISR